MNQGSIYLVAIIDWYSHYILSYEVSTTLDNSFCLEALNCALNISRPEIFNSDQGVQFTSRGFTNLLKASEIKISMDSRGRTYDNIFIERFWRSLKYEEVYLQDYQNVKEAIHSLMYYFDYYNNKRIHQALNYKTPAQLYWERGEKPN